MLLAHLDESYSDDWYRMAAVVCDGPGALRLASDLDGVINTARVDYGVEAEAELHGYELFQGEKWWVDVPPRARIAVYTAAFEAIAKHSTCLILRGVHSAGLRQRYIYPDPPHTVVLAHLLERLNEYALRHDEQVIVIADEVGDQARHRDDLVSYRRHGTSGYRGQRLSTIVDTLHFAPSDASRLIQATDLVAFMYRRINDHQETSDRATRANTALWGILQDKIHHELCWMP